MMKIKHLLLPVFFAFAAVSATAQDERVLQIPGHEKPLKLEMLEERMMAKLEETFIDDIVITLVRRSYSPFAYLVSLIDEHTLIMYYVDLAALRDAEYSHLNNCEMRLNRSTSRDLWLIHFTACFGEPGSGVWAIPNLFFHRDELGI